MKTLIKTNIKGNEVLHVKESTDEIFEKLIDKYGFVLFTRVNYSGKDQGKMILKKSCIKMVKA